MLTKSTGLALQTPVANKKGIDQAVKHESVSDSF